MLLLLCLVGMKSRSSSSSSPVVHCCLAWPMPTHHHIQSYSSTSAWTNCNVYDYSPQQCFRTRMIVVIFSFVPLTMCVCLFVGLLWYDVRSPAQHKSSSWCQDSQCSCWARCPRWLKQTTPPTRCFEAQPGNRCVGLIFLWLFLHTTAASEITVWYEDNTQQCIFILVFCWHHACFRKTYFTNQRTYM